MKNNVRITNPNPTNTPYSVLFLYTLPKTSLCQDNLRHSIEKKWVWLLSNKRYRSNTVHWRQTCKAILRQASLIRGLSIIRFHTVLRPWVTRSPLCNSFSSFSQLPGQQKLSNNLRVEFGKWGASHSNLLRDLSEAGKESLSVSAYKI